MNDVSCVVEGVLRIGGSPHAIREGQILHVARVAPVSVYVGSGGSIPGQDGGGVTCPPADGSCSRG